MIIKVPVTFDYTVTICYNDGSTEISSCFPTVKGFISCSFKKVNGYDANGNRVTNLVGYDGIDFLKKCPSCSCEKIVTEFGYSGRTTNQKRDQSQCTNCRGQY